MKAGSAFRESFVGPAASRRDGQDSDAFGKLGVYWYELRRGPQPTWTKHIISYDEGIGSGVQLGAVDLDGDGDIDVVVAGKGGGPVWFENKRIE